MPDLKHNAHIKAPELRALIQGFCEGYLAGRGNINPEILHHSLQAWLVTYDLNFVPRVVEQYFLEWHNDRQEWQGPTPHVK